MKILYFTNEPSPYTTDLFNELSDSNELTVIYGAKDIDKRNGAWNHGKKAKYNSVYFYALALQSIRKLCADNYDVYIIGYYACINAAILIISLNFLKKPFYLSADGGFIDKNETFISRIIKTFFISKASHYFSSGDYTDKYLQYYGADKRKIVHIPFTSLKAADILDDPIPYADKIMLRKTYGFNYEKLFISVGSFIERKGYNLFLNTIKHHNYNNCGFLIIGGGDQKNELLKIVTDNNMHNIHIIDFCPKEEIFKFMKMSDVFFFPSKEDIWGLVINEAMANGLPVISSDNVIASLELIDKQYLYNVDEAESLLRLLDFFVNTDQETLNRISKENICKIRQYTIENYACIIERTIKKYEK